MNLPFLIILTLSSKWNPAEAYIDENWVGSVDFNELLETTFGDCLVHMLNYQGRDVVVTRTPVVISKLPSLTKISEQGYGYDFESRNYDENHQGYQTFPENMRQVVNLKKGIFCVAQIYLSPSAKPTRKNIQGSRKKGREKSKGKGSSKESQYKLNVPSPFKELFGMGHRLRVSMYGCNEGRYNILIRDHQQGSENLALWLHAYAEILGDNPMLTQGLILTMASSKDAFLSQSQLMLLDHIQIVNQFHLMKQTPVLSSTRITREGLSRYMLDREIGRVNDARLNVDIPWIVLKDILSVKNLGNIYSIMKSLSKVSYVTRNGHIGMNNARILIPHGVLYEGMENFVMARLILGENVTMLSSFPYGLEKVPMIQYDSADTPYFSGPKNELGLISCSKSLSMKEYKYGTLQVLRELATIYDSWSTALIVISYVLVPLIFALLYYFTRIKEMHGKKLLRFVHFEIGAINLIRQSIDRRWNHRRFGFMAWTTAGLLLAGIVLGPPLKANVKVLNSPYVERYRPYLSLYGVDRWGLAVFTDVEMPWQRMLKELARHPAYHNSDGNYADMGKFVMNQTDIVLASWKPRIRGIKDYITNRGSGPCKWSRPSIGDAYHWHLPPPPADRGWMLSNWMDPNIPKRLSQLVVSGIAEKWRSAVSLEDKNDREWWSGAVFVRSVSLGCKIRFIFLCGTYAMWGATGMWLLENSLCLVLGWLRRRAKNKDRKKMSTRGELRRVVEGLYKLLRRKRPEVNKLVAEGMGSLNTVVMGPVVMSTK